MAKDKQATKICKYCSTEIPFSAKVCPNCRKKVKGGKLKWIILGVVAIIILGGIFGSGGDSEKKKADSVQTNEEAVDNADGTPAQKETTPANTTEAKATEAKIEYTSYDCTELFDDLDNNALNAEKKHQDEYVLITGYLGTIDSDGKYFAVAAAEDNYDYMFKEIRCNITSDAQLDAIAGKNKGDTIVVKGQIIQIGEVLGYTVDTIGLK